MASHTNTDANADTNEHDGAHVTETGGERSTQAFDSTDDVVPIKWETFIPDAIRVRMPHHPGQCIKQYTQGQPGIHTRAKMAMDIPGQSEMQTLLTKLSGEVSEALCAALLHSILLNLHRTDTDNDGTEQDTVWDQATPSSWDIRVMIRKLDGEVPDIIVRAVIRLLIDAFERETTVTEDRS